MHLRAILSLPCPPPQLKVGAAVMINILGQDSMESTKELLKNTMAVSGEFHQHHPIISITIIITIIITYNHQELEFTGTEKLNLDVGERWLM